MGKSTISMAIFNSFLYVYQRIKTGKSPFSMGKSTINGIKWPFSIAKVPDFHFASPRARPPRAIRHSTDTGPPHIHQTSGQKALVSLQEWCWPFRPGFSVDFDGIYLWKIRKKIRKNQEKTGKNRKKNMKNHEKSEKIVVRTRCFVVQNCEQLSEGNITC